MQVAMVAAGFTPGEADQLRRAMAAWRRKGGLDHFETRLIEGMGERGYSEEFARQIFQQILGFGEYGFPESHAASFALLVYVSAWLKCHEPAAFTCALLNSQPMGFYAPSQLVQDAQRHGVEVRAVEVNVSNWDCTLECDDNRMFGRANPPGVAVGGAVPDRSPHAQPAVRLGLRQVHSFGEAAAQRLMAARAQAPFYSASDLAHRAQLNKKEVAALANAGALAPLHGHRRQARWAARGVETRLPLFAQVAEQDWPAPLHAPSEGQNIVDDYAHLGLTLGRHPIALIREHLHKLRMIETAQLQNVAHGQRVRVAGLVTCRQRPASSSGVTFVTLEDETGCSNIVVWQRVAEKQRRELLSARLLGVAGKVERDGEVIHVIAQHLEDHSALLGQLVSVSRDFH